MKTVILLVLLVSLVGSLSIVLAAPNRWLLAFTVAAPELSPWLVLLSLLGLVLAGLALRPLVPVFAITLVICLWPVSQITTVQSSIRRQLGGGTSNLFLASLRRPTVPPIQPEMLPMNMRLYRQAEAQQPRPILINIYGGAWQRGEPNDDSRFAQYMAGKGYAVFAIDYRHAPAAMYPAQIDDVNAAIAFIRENAAQYGADPERIVL